MPVSFIATLRCLAAFAVALLCLPRESVIAQVGPCAKGPPWQGSRASIWLEYEPGRKFKHPLSLKMGRPTEPVKGRCGDWVVRRGTLRVITNQLEFSSGDQTTDPRLFKSTASGETKKSLKVYVLYFIGLFEGPPPPSQTDLRDIGEQEIATFGTGPEMRNIIFGPRESQAWNYLPFVTVANGSPVVGIVACLRIRCPANSEFIDDAEQIASQQAILADAADTSTPNPTPAPTLTPSTGSTTTSRTEPKTEPKTETKDAVAVHVAIFESPRDFTARSRYRHDVAVAAMMRCNEREGLAGVTTSAREPYRWIDIHNGSGVESREFPDFCVVLTSQSQERCRRIPFLKSNDGWVPPSPLQIDVADFEALPLCPPPPPYAVSIRMDVEPDGRPIDVSMLHSTAIGGGLAIMGKGLRRSASGYEVNLTRDEATRLLKTPLNQRLNHNQGAFQLTALDVDVDRRTILVVVKPRFMTLENVKFRMVKGAKGSEENTNLCSLQLVVPKDRRIGGNWSAVTGNGLRLQVAPNTGNQYQLAPGSGVTVAQLLVASGEGLSPLRLAPPDGNDWNPRCRVKDEEFNVSVEELRKGEVLRNVEQPGPSFIAIITGGRSGQTPAILQVLEDQGKQSEFYRLGLEVVQDVAKRKVAGRGWYFSSLMELYSNDERPRGGMIGVHEKSERPIQLATVEKLSDELAARSREAVSSALVNIVPRVMNTYFRDRDLTGATPPKANAIFFGRVFDPAGSVCGPGLGIMSWPGWEGRKLFEISLIPDEWLQDMVEARKLLAPSRQRWVYRCAIANHESVQHYAIATSGLADTFRTSVARFLAQQAAEFFEADK